MKLSYLHAPRLGGMCEFCFRGKILVFSLLLHTHTLLCNLILLTFWDLQRARWLSDNNVSTVQKHLIYRKNVAHSNICRFVPEWHTITLLQRQPPWNSPEMSDLKTCFPTCAALPLNDTPLPFFSSNFHRTIPCLLLIGIFTIGSATGKGYPFIHHSLTHTQKHTLTSFQIQNLKEGLIQPYY